MIELDKVHYVVTNKGLKTEVLQGITCSMQYGRLYTILGEPRSGKSALMTLLCGLEVPTEGKIRIDGVDITSVSQAKHRRDKVSIIDSHLLLFPHLTILENIIYPMRKHDLNREDAKERGYERLEQVGLPKTLANQLPKQISHEEALRAATARSLTTQARIILVDDLNWTGAYMEEIINLLYDIAHRSLYCIVVATQSKEIANRSDESFELQEGKIFVSNTLTSIKEVQSEGMEQPRKITRDMISFESSYRYEDGEFKSV